MPRMLARLKLCEFKLKNPIPSGLLADFMPPYPYKESEYTVYSCQIMLHDRESFSPGDEAEVEIFTVTIFDIWVGMKFKICRGPHVLGEGKILQIWDTIGPASRRDELLKSTH